jgi:hypothetical protein
MFNNPITNPKLVYSQSRDSIFLNSVRYMKKAILVTGRGGPYGCETSRFPHFLDDRLIDGGEVVSLTPIEKSNDLIGN